MTAPISRSSAALLSVGALAILLLGAFTRSDNGALPPSLPAAGLEDVAIESAGEPELPAGLSPELAEIFRLAQAHVDENVILAYIHNSGQSYSPTADEILYLSDLGLSQTVIGALFQQKPAASPQLLANANAAATAGALVPAVFPKIPPLSATPTANGGLFYNDLAPYGTWIQVPNYGQVWQPAAETVNPDWRPYLDQGKWQSTDNGWYWQSDYSWGAIVFHYGRWSKDNRFGWVWVPDKVWGPAWVGWRIALSYSGWAPLPPGVGLATAGALTPINRGFSAAFGSVLPAGWFTFVNEANFLSHGLPSYALPPVQTAAIYARSLPVNNYSLPFRKTLNLGSDHNTTIAGVETEADPALVRGLASRTRELPAKQVLAPENDAETLIAIASSAETIGELPRLAPGAATQSPPSSPKNHRRRRMDNFPARGAFASAPHWEPPVNRDSPVFRPNDERFAAAPQPDPMRMMPGPTQSSVKPGR